MTGSHPRPEFFSIIGTIVRALIAGFVAALTLSNARLGAQSSAPPHAADSLAPVADHHTHLASGDDWAYVVHATRNLNQAAPTAKDLIASLDSAHVRKAVVLSTAYFFGAPDALPSGDRDEYAKVRAENDWVAAQVALYPDRLVGFCSVNPLRDYAQREIARCKSAGLRGLKLHLANSRVDLTNSDHVARVREVFAAANAAGLPIVAHIRTGVQFGAADARIVIQHFLRAAPDVAVQIAHLAGWGGYDQANDDSLGAFIDAIASGEVDRSRIYFDIASVSSVAESRGITRTEAGGWTPTILRRMRQIGFDRLLFATDYASESPSTLAAFLRDQSGLTREEVRRLFGTVAPYVR
jgi:predicted TIM-barrel fold metal-dependent hydrolase